MGKFLLTDYTANGIITTAQCAWKGERGLNAQLKNGTAVVGLKQTRKALRAGRASAVFLAYDADPALVAPLELLCHQQNLPLDQSLTMRELGAMCGISVGAAAAAVLLQPER